MTERTRTPERGTSRRRFLKIVAAGSAAALTSAVAPIAEVAAAAKRRSPAAPKPEHPAPGMPIPAAIQTEIDSQKEYVIKALQAIRDHPLAPGSDPAFVFAALKAPRRSRARSGSRAR